MWIRDEEKGGRKKERKMGKRNNGNNTRIKLKIIRGWNKKKKIWKRYERYLELKIWSKSLATTTPENWNEFGDGESNEEEKRVEEERREEEEEDMK